MSGRSLRSFRDPDTLREFVSRVREGLYITTAEGKILDANPALLSMFGVSSLEELSRYSAPELFWDPALRAQEIALLKRDGEVSEFEFQIRRPDGGVRTVLDTCYAVTDPSTGELLFHGVLVDITERKRLEGQLRELTIRDPLTGCYNRRYLSDVETQLNAKSDAWGTVIVDIDHFKEYNDQHGHQAGDDVLVKVSRFLMQRIRAEDAVIRLGGDEFLVLLLTDHGVQTSEVVERLTQAAHDAAPVSFSLGWAVRESGEPLQRTIGRADEALILVRVRERQRRWERRSQSPG